MTLEENGNERRRKKKKTRVKRHIHPNIFTHIWYLLTSEERGYNKTQGKGVNQSREKKKRKKRRNPQTGRHISLDNENRYRYNFFQVPVFMAM